MVKVASLTLAAALGLAALTHSGTAAAGGYVVGVGVPRVVVAPPIVAYPPYGIGVYGAPYGYLGAPYYRGYGGWGHRYAYRPGWGYAHGWHRGYRR
jgi:hypothetical protein